MKQSKLHTAHGNVHWVILVGLFIITVLLGVMLVWQREELNNISKKLDALNQSARDPQADCRDSGGTYSATTSKCTCPKDYSVEAGYCVDAMGTFGGRMGDEMRANLQLQMRQAR
jgi:hypothetical protein